MEYIMENLWIAWVAVGVFFLIVELLTTALVSIWFVPAATITCLFSLVVHSLVWQIALFVVMSAVFMVVFRKIYNKYIKKDKDEIKQEEHLIGKTAKTSEDTDSHGGRVLAGDVYWRAVTENGEKIEKDETVIITGVQGTTLIIKREN